MKVLSIDPGYERLGIAILEKNKGDQKETLLYSDCFKTSPKLPHHKRLANIFVEISKIIKEYDPKFLSIETLFFNNNAKTALMVAEARGTIISCASYNNLEVYEFSPQQIKSAVTGNGRSDKEGIIKMVPLIISIKKEIKYDDEYDAIAAGIAFFSSNKYPQ